MHQISSKIGGQKVAIKASVSQDFTLKTEFLDMRLAEIADLGLVGDRGPTAMCMTCCWEKGLGSVANGCRF